MSELTRAGGPPAIRARLRLICAAACTGLVVAALIAGAGTASAGPMKAALQFAPNPFDYSNVYAGQLGQQTFTLTNTGTAVSGALTLTLQGPQTFSVTADACDAISLKPTKSCKVTVQFAPTSTETQTATLTASSPKSGVGTLATLVLTGTGLGRMYWINIPDATVYDANIDGSNPQQIASSQDQLYEIATDGSHIYWTDAAGTIYEANTDGSNQHVIVSGQDFPTGITVSGGQIYWANGGDGTIWAANLDGTNPQTLVTGQVEPLSIAVDSSHIYWATLNAGGSIWEANLDGSNAHVIVANQSSPHGLAVYGNQLFIASVQDETIYKANLDGTNPQPVVKQLSGLTAMAVAYGRVYWAGSQASLQEVNIDSTNLQTVMSNVQQMYGLAFTPGP
jgi:hypothetical protein